jgi:hypothetical protein
VGHDNGSDATLIVSGGWLDVEDSVRVGSSSGSQGSLSLTGGVLRVGRFLHVQDTGLVQFSGGAVDIEAGSAIFESAGSSAALLDGLTQQIASGRGGGGAWDGPGIRSSLAAADPGVFGVGIARNGDLAVPWAVFAGEAVSADSILIRATFLGDSNLDGLVDIADLAALASSWEQQGVWSSGDFDGSGVVDVHDLKLLAGNWESSGSTAGSLEAVLTSLGLASDSVPEPGALGVFGLTWGLAAAARRRAGSN